MYADAVKQIIPNAHDSLLHKGKQMSFLSKGGKDGSPQSLWLVGFAEAKASFLVLSNCSNQVSKALSGSPVFVIHHREPKLLWKARDILKFGRISKSGCGLYRLIVRDVKALNKLVATFGDPFHGFVLPRSRVRVNAWVTAVGAPLIKLSKPHATDFWASGFIDGEAFFGVAWNVAQRGLGYDISLLCLFDTGPPSGARKAPKCASLNRPHYTVKLKSNKRVTQMRWLKLYRRQKDLFVRSGRSFERLKRLVDSTRNTGP